MILNIMMMMMLPGLVARQFRLVFDNIDLWFPYQFPILAKAFLPNGILRLSPHQMTFFFMMSIKLNITLYLIFNFFFLFRIWRIKLWRPISGWNRYANYSGSIESFHPHSYFVFLQYWYDYKLQWEPSEYGEVSMLHVPSDHIWRPDISLYNK